MPRIRDILPAVLKQRSSAIDQALSVALTHAEPEEIGPLASGMLGRGKANAAEALVVEYRRLPAQMQQQLVAQAEQLATSIRRAASRRGPEAAGNALTIIEKAASTRLAYLVTALCRHADPDVREQAGRCIVALARRCETTASPDDAPHLDALSTRFLIEAVEQAVVLFGARDHLSVLSAMLWLVPRAMPEALAALRLPEHSAVEPLCHRITALPDRDTRRSLLALIGVRPLAEACRSALAEANAQQQLGEALVMGHLLALPSNRKTLGRVREVDTLWPDARQQQGMPDHARRWLPTFLAALPVDPQEQAIQLSKLARHQDPATRLAVARRLLVIARSNDPSLQPAIDNANDTLALMTRDPEPAIARTALWHLTHHDYAGLPRILADLVNSRHEVIRKVAAKHLAPLGFTRYWDAWPKLDPKRRVAAGRALIKIDEDFHRHLGTRLASRDPDKRLRALGIIATLNQGVFFEEVLLELAGSSDLHIVASAVKALSGCTSAPAKQALELAMQHEDTRIRANAVEAIGHAQAASNLEHLLTMSQDPAQRPRANAIKALLELRAKDALPSLTRMLSDQRAPHRISALWLIDELGVLQLARLVAEMAVGDEDERVKKRAGQVIQHLIDDLEHQVDHHDHALASDPPTEAA